MRRMVSWLIALSGHCSRVDNVLISVAILALTKMAAVIDRDPVIIPFPVKIGPFLDSRSR